MPDEAYVGREVFPREVAKALRILGVAWEDRLPRVAIAMWESGGYNRKGSFVCWEGAYYVNRNADGSVASTDRGIWQINDVHHPSVSDAQAYNLYEAAKYARTLNLSLWVSWSKFLAPEPMAALKVAGDAGDLKALANWKKARDIWQRAIMGCANDLAVEVYKVPTLVRSQSLSTGSGA